MASFEVGEESLEELEARHSIETAELEVQTAAQLKACKKKERAYYEAHAQQQLYDLQARHRDEIEELEEWVEAGNEVGSSSTAGGEGDGAAAAAAKQKEAEAALAAAAAAADATANKKAKAQRKKNKALAKAELEEKVRAPRLSSASLCYALYVPFVVYTLYVMHVSSTACSPFFFFCFPGPRRDGAGNGPCRARCGACTAGCNFAASKLANTGDSVGWKLLI